MAAQKHQVHRKKQNKSGKTMNRVELMIFGAMTIYIVGILFMYLNSEPIQGYEVQLGSFQWQKHIQGWQFVRKSY